MLRIMFNAMEWEVGETGLFAINRFTGEKILLDRFEEPYRNGILKHNEWMGGNNFTFNEHVTAIRNFREMELIGSAVGEQQ